MLRLRKMSFSRHFKMHFLFLNENVWISIKITLKFFLEGSINNTPALVQIMAWCRPGNKQLSEPMMVGLLMHTCIPQPQWVNSLRPRQMDAISQTTFSNAFSWMKMFEFRLKFHWSLFPRVQLTILQQWFRYWLGRRQAIIWTNAG